MRTIPSTMRNTMALDPYYRRCARENLNCDGRITWEHALTYAGKQISEPWAIIPLCAFHHAVDFHQDGGDLNKEINELVALLRATPEELGKYPLINWERRVVYLAVKYEVHGPDSTCVDDECAVCSLIDETL